MLKKNVGAIDKVIRFFIVSAIAVSCFTHQITGTFDLIAGALADG